ncbi:hypothetical protein Asulf_01719 [Archaeoglobus sulfaticallidus PM70-1]|uniref:Thioredoxin domain-containing protein n=1 Tax=Archaeoglobus sulfaticallidus PM70-1 TaxID=387631 RepID=N0BN20_9EURY|nr:protein disulfide isomerase family protein [Archaeoglobus sulfaticallidus]AGK61690.1 hypothetical protein Asulf_01719 [Archaeoglobus sulfaticallidus PM70-1]
MRWLLLILIVFLAGCVTEKTEDQVVKGDIYFFFSPNCPHCKNVEPYVINASKKVEINFCQVENLTDTCKEIAEKIKLRGVPTAVVVEKDKVYVYSGETKVKNLMLEIMK